MKIVLVIIQYNFFLCYNLRYRHVSLYCSIYLSHFENMGKVHADLVENEKMVNQGSVGFTKESVE